MTGLDQLLDMLAVRSAQRGRFILSSGKESTLYVDARLTTMTPDGLALIGPLGLDAIRRKWRAIDAVGGLTLGADPVAYAIAYASAGTERPLRAFTVRKEPKAHGTGRLIEGPFQAGDHVVIVEDVITTGASALRAADAVHRAGGIVEGILAIVDRDEGGREALEGANLAVVSLTRGADILARMPAGPHPGQPVAG